MATSHFTSKKIDVPGLTSLGRGFQSATPGTCAGVEERVTKYTGHYDGEAEADSQTKQRSENAAEISTSYYNLVTDFFEYGYGQSFHFAPVMDELTFDECLAEYERGIAKTLGIGAGGKILVCAWRLQFHVWLQITWIAYMSVATVNTQLSMATLSTKRPIIMQLYC